MGLGEREADRTIHQHLRARGLDRRTNRVEHGRQRRGRQ